MRAIAILSFPFALALGLGACAPAPFDAQQDCPKEVNCGQCASRGPCAWCGTQCIAVGKTECPAGVTQTPDRCPTPTDDAGAPVATANGGVDSAIKTSVGPEKYEKVRTALKRAFPSANVSDAVVDGVVQVLARPGSKFAHAGVNTGATSNAPPPPTTRRVTEKEHPLYLGHATHHRVSAVPPSTAPVQSKFMGSLPLVRVRLPAALEGENPKITTQLGDVYLSGDHLIGSIELLAGKYKGREYLGYTPERVDLVTPPRSDGARFAAIALYLGYKKAADKAPSFFILEAGTSTGDAKMLYFSPEMKPIVKSFGYYVPTPFSSTTNAYSGWLTMSGDEPEKLVVKSFAPGQADPYITVTVDYTRQKTMDAPWPLEITVGAAARVALIAQTMGIPDAVPLERLLADIAKNELTWDITPHAGPVAPTATATATPTAMPRASATPNAGPAAP